MKNAHRLTAILSLALFVPFLGCGDAKTPEQQQKEQKYRAEFGDDDKVMEASTLVSAYQNNQLQANSICNQSPLFLIDGFIADMGSNSLGTYIDFKNNGMSNDSDVRIFLELSDWNNEAIKKIKRNDLIRVVGLCKGQIEAFGAKSKIIIGNARILKIGKEFL